MRMIDEKGRLFGKINVIDFLAILLVFCLMPMLYFGYKIFHRPVKAALTQQSKALDVYCKINNLIPEDLQHIAVGDILLDDAGNNIGEILSVGEPAIYTYNADLGDGNIVSYQDPARRQVLVKARVLGEIRKDAFYYKEEKIAIGSKIWLKTNKYNLEGIIESALKPSMPMLIEPVKAALKIKFRNLKNRINKSGGYGSLPNFSPVFIPTTTLNYR